MDVSIIIVNYNVKEFLQNLLHSIDKSISRISKEIIVVDNSSDDGSAELIRAKFPKVNLIENKSNVGFGRANNQALEIAQGKFLLLINPDAIVSEDTIQKMISFFNANIDAGLAGCKILNPDGSIQLACRRSFPGPWTSFCKVSGLSNLFPNSKMFARYNLTYLNENDTYEVDAISGSFMMMPAEVYKKVGGFDEEFFMYGEDLDLCYRIQQAGYRVYYVHSTQIIHYKGESTKRSSMDDTKVFYDAMHLFVKKHFSSFFLVEFILRSAIGFRKFFAFTGKWKLVLFSVLTDFVFFNVCVFFAEIIYKSMTTWIGFLPDTFLIIYTVPALLHIIVAASFGVYRTDSLSVLRNIGAVFISFFLLTSLTFFFKEYAFSRAVVIIAYSMFMLVTVFWRVVLKLFFKIGVKFDGSINKRTLVVGTNDEAINIANKLTVKKSDIHSFIGLLSQSQSDIATVVKGFEVVGSIDNFKKVIAEKDINEVIFPSGELSYSQLMSLVSETQGEKVEFKLTGSDLNYVVGKTTVSMLDDIPLIEVQYNISSPLKRFVKRSFDLMFSTFTLLFVYPFIYLSSLIRNTKSDFSKFVLGMPSVLSGRKSLVGPIKINDENNIYVGRQGLTGLWYIENSESHESDKLDFYYAKNQNIWLDLEILGRSFNKMCNRSH